MKSLQRKTHLNVAGSAIAIAAFLAITSTASAGNFPQCNNYANSAVTQQGQNIANGCGYSGPRWQSNYGAHMIWCMQAPTSMINSETNARINQLNACGGGGPGPGPGPGPAQKTFWNPKTGGLRLDWCRVWANQCGGPAASQYCQSKGYSHAVSWTKAVDIGNFTNTRVIGTGQVCSGGFCDGFKKIRCSY